MDFPRWPDQPKLVSLGVLVFPEDCAAVGDVENWLKTKPIQANITAMQALNNGLSIKTAGVTLTAKAAAIHVYVPEALMLNPVQLKVWQDRLKLVTIDKGVPFEIHSIEEFIR